MPKARGPSLRSRVRPVGAAAAIVVLWAASTVFLVQKTNSVPLPGVRTLEGSSSEYVDTAHSNVAAKWVGYGSGWPDCYHHAFCGYHLLRVEDGEVVPAVSIDRSRPFNRSATEYTTRLTSDETHADAALWLVQQAGYEAPVPPDHNDEAAVTQLAVWHFTSGLDLGTKDLEALQRLKGLTRDDIRTISGLIKATEDMPNPYPGLPPTSIWLVGSSERQSDGTVAVWASLAADRTDMPNQPLIFSYPGGSVVATTDDHGEVNVQVPALSERALRVRITWRGLLKAGTTFVSQATGRARSQTLMTIRDAVIERTVLVPVQE